MDYTNFDPSLKAAVDAAGLNPKKLNVAMEVLSAQKRIRVVDRFMVPVSDGAKIAMWKISSLSSLYRGNGQPPRDIQYYPPSVVEHFFFVEQHFLALCQAIGPRTDQEMEEVYGAIQRRPDGKSIGPVHDFIWQVGALLLGTRALSEAEFLAIFGQLHSSARKFAMRPVSRFYADYIKTELGRRS
jgi:hypothetical protein